MSAASVIHISPTPLVGAPSKISKTLRKIGYESFAVAISDYPKNGPLYKKFTDDVSVFAESSPEQLELIHSRIENADIIHIHNDLPRHVLELVLKLNTKAKFVYQVHSPLREGPLYYERSEVIGLPFSDHLVVAQYQPRHYQTYRAVPNLVDFKHEVTLREDGQRLRVMFSPSHTRSGRWNAKYSEKVEKDLKALSQIGKIDLIWPEIPLHPKELMDLRKSVHVTIDEVMTGAFHQVSLEGLCAGNVTINRADYFSKAIFAQCTASKEMPPFVYADEASLSDIILELADSPSMTREIQSCSFEYFDANMKPTDLIGNFKYVYSKII